MATGLRPCKGKKEREGDREATGKWDDPALSPGSVRGLREGDGRQNHHKPPAPKNKRPAGFLTFTFTPGGSKVLSWSLLPRRACGEKGEKGTRGRREGTVHHGRAGKKRKNAEPLIVDVGPSASAVGKNLHKTLHRETYFSQNITEHFTKLYFLKVFTKGKREREGK
ncbi:hypothetical protein AKJ37_06830 [candidate division MSBL1 archaeon SCGC-AAA259I09]|uniref:Uncharacterized protein n=1 Tax=candidate division MSBL1 archaeon SCGC-AAA259I09 TaxID=1698267 RepID=A0A133UMK7_9EURY|nr:hypothetical protein AKJ37_06830 [candidate division MSBL1 archaeon SCGC-AAA259I09]